MADSPNQVCCSACHEWYDARASSCYLCGEDRPDHNQALKNAVNTERLNSALSRQARYAGAEKGIRTPGPQGGTGPSDLYRVPYASDLAASIKDKLQQGGAFG